ncbi:MAG: hemolysin family protein [Candidatus Desulfofervidus auxilii]|nr:hemolysin family protein [Candidatus Desulfofervidus auxilii]
MEIIYFKLILIFILLCFSALFSSSETALFSLTRYQILKLKETKNGKIIASLLEKPAHLLISILIGNESVNVTASALATSVAIALYDEKGKWITLAVMTPILLLWGEIVPKAFALTKAPSFSLKIAPFINFFVKLVTPIRNFIRYVVNIALYPLPAVSKEEPCFLDNEFLQLLESASHEDGFKIIEREFIANLLRFRHKSVSEIMVPRPDMFIISLDTPIKELKKLLNYQCFSRIPVYDRDPDNIIGILHTKTLLGLNKIEGTVKDLKEKFIQPYFVPSTKKGEELFWEMQRKKIAMVMVVNEYGSVVGLITMEDLLEELFGEIYDEYDMAEKWYKEIAPYKYKVMAKMSLKDFNYIFKTNLKAEEDTVGGLILAHLGRLPQKGETIQIENLKFTVIGLKGRRITELIVERLK